MEDSEVIAAISARDPAGLAGAYDAYAAPLYGYCRFMLGEPGYAADALRDTFAGAAAEPGRLGDASQLRASLYGIARDQCRRRMDIVGAGFDEAAGELGQPDGRHAAERAEVRAIIRAILATLPPQEHEILELRLRHHLDDAEVAAVVGVSWSRACALAERAAGRLETNLDALLIARTSRDPCPELDKLLAGSDGRLTAQTGNLVAWHVERCEVCARHRHGHLRPEVLSGLLPLAPLPADLRDAILAGAGADMDAMPSGRRLAHPVASLLTGFRSIGWSRIRANPGSATAFTAVAIWVAAAVSATLITVSGMHSVRSLAAQDRGQNSAASAPEIATSAPASAPAVVSPSSRPARPARPPAPARLAPPAQPSATVSPGKSPKPTPTHPAASPTSPTASTPVSPSPTPTPTHSHTPSPRPSPSPTSTPPSPSPSATPTPT
jgi:RNA polymerase sigma factor (sigma-70 family)